MALTPNIFDEVQELLGSVSVEDAQERITALDSRIEELRTEQQKWYALLGLKQQLGDVATGNGNGRGDLPTLREAVPVLFQQWNAQQNADSATLSALRSALRSRGWLGDGDAEDHRLQMTLSNMVKRGELERPEKGVYRLPPTAVPAAEGDEREIRMELGSQ